MTDRDYFWGHKGFDDMKPAEAEEYLNWYLSMIPKALVYLENSLCAFNPGWEWKADLTEESLKPLSLWLFRTAVRIERPLEEVEKEIQIRNYPAHIAWSLRNNRFHFDQDTSWNIFRASLYFAEILRSNVGELYWDILKKPKSNIFFNHPALFSMTRKEYCVVSRILGNTVSGMLRGEKTEYGVYNIYLTWKKIFTEGSKFLETDFKNAWSEKDWKQI